MMRGLSEREALRQAFGSYVDRDVAERILQEGERRGPGARGDRDVRRRARLHPVRGALERA